MQTSQHLLAQCAVVRAATLNPGGSAMKGRRQTKNKTDRQTPGGFWVGKYVCLVISVLHSTPTTIRGPHSTNLWVQDSSSITGELFSPLSSIDGRRRRQRNHRFISIFIFDAQLNVYCFKLEADAVLMECRCRF